MNKITANFVSGIQKYSHQSGKVRLGILISSLLLILATGIFAYMASAATTTGKAVYGPGDLQPWTVFPFLPGRRSHRPLHPDHPERQRYRAKPC